jgi:DNA-binding transcriptional MerR regulator
MEWFTRRHAVILARSSPSRLKYLEKTGIVIPRRVQADNRLEVLYSWEQILEIRTIARLRQYLSFQTIRKIVHFFQEHGIDPSLRNKQLVVKDGSVTWVRSSSSVIPEMIQLHGKRHSEIGQFVLSPIDLHEPPDDLTPKPPREKKVVSLQDFKQKLNSPR